MLLALMPVTCLMVTSPRALDIAQAMGRGIGSGNSGNYGRILGGVTGSPGPG